MHTGVVKLVYILRGRYVNSYVMLVFLDKQEANLLTKKEEGNSCQRESEYEFPRSMQAACCLFELYGCGLWITGLLYGWASSCTQAFLFGL